MGYYNEKHSAAKFVKRGYGQVEPNHLSAQHTGQIYAQLPAAKDIEVLENGQFVKYDYKAGVCDFAGPGEWMLVFNEVKVYRDFLGDADFAMIKDHYNARVYSPVSELKDLKTRELTGLVKDDPYEPQYNADPFKTQIAAGPALMPEGTAMVPRVLKTNVGDIYTTNMVDEEALVVGDELTPRAADGILAKVATGKEEAAPSMVFQVVKVYTMPDGQPGVKVMRIKQ